MTFTLKTALLFPSFVGGATGAFSLEIVLTSNKTINSAFLNPE